jgi:hypothetical protein
MQCAIASNPVPAVMPGGRSRVRRHRFAEIHGGAAAHGDDAVAAFGAIDLERVARRRLGRVGGRAVIERRGPARGRLHARGEARRHHALVGAKQGLPDAEQIELRRQQFQRAEIELDASEISDQCHGAPPCRVPHHRRGGRQSKTALP